MNSFVVASQAGEYFADIVSSGPIFLGFLAAALAGLVSFASPCVIPLVPGYVSYLAGVVGGEVAANKVTKNRTRVTVSALLFVLGFTVVFIGTTVTVLGTISVLMLNANVLMRIGGVVTIIMGVVFMGFIPFLQRDTRFAPKRIATWVGAPLLGGIFALGWTPCLGPTLAAIISVSAGTEGMTALRGVVLTIGYCLGLGLPFVLLAMGSTRAVRGVEWLAKYSRKIQIIGGVLLVLVGLALLSGYWATFITWVRQLTVDFGATLI